MPSNCRTQRQHSTWTHHSRTDQGRSHHAPHFRSIPAEVVSLATANCYDRISRSWTLKGKSYKSFWYRRNNDFRIFQRRIGRPRNGETTMTQQAITPR